MAIDEREVDGEVLRKPYERVVDGAVAVGMVFAEAVADYARAFAERLVVIQSEFVHGVEYPAVNGLQAVAHVGYGARDVYRHGVGDERTLEFFVHLYVEHFGH